MFSAWLMLIVAGLLEVCWAIGLKYSECFSRPWPSLFTLLALLSSIYLLANSVRVIPLSTAYGVWVAIGLCGTVIMDVILFETILSSVRMFFLLLLIVSVIGLKITS